MLRLSRLARPASSVAAYAVALVYMLPVLIAVLNSFKSKGEILRSALAPPRRWIWDNYATVLTGERFGGVLLSSIGLTAASVALILAVSALAGYALARWRSRWANALLLLFLSSMFVPFHTIMITLLQTAKALGLTGELGGMALIYGGLMSPLTIFLYRGFVKGIPRELEESAIVDGCGPLQLMIRLIVPLLKPISATAAVLNAMWIWNDFLLPYLVLAKPVTIPLSQMYFYGKYNQQWHLIMAGFVVSTVPIVVFFLLLQKWIVKGLVAGAIKG